MKILYTPNKNNKINLERNVKYVIELIGASTNFLLDKKEVRNQFAETTSSQVLGKKITIKVFGNIVV